MANTHGVSSPEPTMVTKTTQVTSPTKHETNSADASWSSTTMPEGNGDTSDDDCTSTSNPNCSSSNTVHVTFTPLNSPLNTPYTVQPSQFSTLTNVDSSRTGVSQPTAILFTPSTMGNSGIYDNKRLSVCTTANSLSKRQANLQVGVCLVCVVYKYCLFLIILTDFRYLLAVITLGFP